MDKGAYIFYSENDNIDLFIFKKSTYEELKNTLPTNYSCGNIKEDHNCLSVFFHDGMDYLGSGKLEDIPKIIKEKCMMSILNNSYDDIKSNGFINLTKKQFYNLLSFSKSQLDL